MVLQLTPDRDQAEGLALRALAFLAGEPDRLGRFLALTGLGPDDLRRQAQDSGFLSGVLDHLMQDETLLMVFAAEAGLVPEEVARAHRVLAGPSAYDGH